MTNRHAWSAAAKDYIFGVEPEHADPLPAQAAAVEACRSSLRAAHIRARGAIAANATARQFVGVLDAVELTDAPPVARPMRVVLMGRTMAGKSTLLAALTGGSQDRIGVGAQRTSRDVFAAPAVDLPEIEIVDTPGVGAMDGADDVLTAMAEVPGADLVLWVASNDSFQEETAQALRAVAYRGKPIVVALNCRARLVDDLDREDFLSDPDAVFDQHEGHFSSIRSHLWSEGVRPVAEVMVHAEAAQQSRGDSVFGPTLRQASRVECLLEVLARESRERRLARRVLREADDVRTQALVVGNAVTYVEERARECTRVAQGLRKDQARRTVRLIDACQQLIEDDIVRIIGARRDWHQSVTDFGPQVGAQWGAELVTLFNELDEARTGRLQHLAHTVSKSSAEAQHEWASALRPDVSITGFRNFRGLWKRRAAGLVVGGGGAFAAMLAGMKAGALIGAQLGGASGAAAGGVGAAPGAAVGVAGGAIAGGVTALTGSFVVTPLRKKAQSMFISKTKILEANRELLRGKIGEVLTEMQTQMVAAAAVAIEEVRAQVATDIGVEIASERAALLAASELSDQVVAIRSAVSILDRHTVVSLLLVDGRPRLAGAIEKVTRLSGICSAVEVSPNALAEAWLYPPSAPEVLTFGRTADAKCPGPYAGPYVLGLTELVPRANLQRDRGSIIVTDADVPTPVLAAWSATLSDHLGTRVEITRLTEDRNTPA